MIDDYFLLPVLFLIGLIASYQDFRYGKIKNKLIVLGLIWGLGFYFLFLIWALIAPFFSQVFSQYLPSLPPSYIFRVFLNSTIALLVGYLLWYFNLWSAGDGKLFFIFSLLLPLKYYWKSALPYFPSFVLLINTFVPLLIFLIFQNLFYFFRKILIIQKENLFIRKRLSNFKTLIKKNLDHLKIGSGMLLIFILFQLINFEIKTRIIHVDWWWTIAFLTMFLLQKIFRRFLTKGWVLSFLFLITIFYLIINLLTFSKKIISEIPTLIKNSIVFMIIFSIILALLSFTPQDSKKDLPFAFWLSIGVLITIILKGSLISLFLNPKFFLELK
jgi:Flp pilus assembly protein protease CpaA